ncbi:MAG: carbon-nitrogen hydrolase family protein [Parvibaculaceae bacterium]|nr:carbon-nitrogen hydrolase family protein [Parvibaculaceae bacterium]
MSNLKLACAQYPIGHFTSTDEWAANAARWVAEAVGKGAQLLVFPEYGSMELTSLMAPAVQQDLLGQIEAMQAMLPLFLATYEALARKHGVIIVAPSLPVKEEGRFLNRAHVFSPHGLMGYQDKRQMTRFEREQWFIEGGTALHLFDLASVGVDARFGITICYDVEFPLIAHALSEAGADLVLAPSCTDRMAGAHRVQTGARARALENQIYVAVSPTVGEAPWSPAVDVNNGWASVLATPDRGFPEDGVIAAGVCSEPCWVYADLDFDLVRSARADAQVFTRSDWVLQDRPSLHVTPPVLPG